MQTPAVDRFQSIGDAVIVVDGSGIITSVTADPIGPVDIDLGPGAVIMPGLIDTHVHAPQWPQVGTGLDLPLERWLFEYTLPLERRYADRAWAARVWDDLVPSLLAAGTTTAVYYSTIDVAATTSLAAACARHGQRAFVGRVAMDHPDGTPEWYRDLSTDQAIADSLRSIEQIRSLESPLVAPMLTPRFAPACTDSLLHGIAELADATGVSIQTHCSESDWEHRYAYDRFGISDTAALERFGLIREGTVLAHCGHVDRADLATIGGVGAGIAHCPLSNAYFGDAVFAARRALDDRVRVGLGSDLAGGFAVGLLRQCSMAITSSRLLASGTNAALDADRRGVAGSEIDAVAAFWMATGGGAALLSQPTGLLAAGRPFDAIVLDLEAASHNPRSGLRWWPDLDDDARTFEKIVHTGGAEDIAQVWVAGRLLNTGVSTTPAPQRSSSRHGRDR